MYTLWKSIRNLLHPTALSSFVSGFVKNVCGIFRYFFRQEKDTKEEELEDADYQMSGKNHRNWLDLPDEAIAVIFSRLDPVETLKRASRVCMTWRRVCKQKLITWPTIQIHNLGSVRRLNYITNSSLNSCNCKGIRCLKIVKSKVTPKELSDVASKLPLLEDLEISYWGHVDGCDDNTEDLKMSYCTSTFGCLEVIGRSCPLLKSLKLNSYFRFYVNNYHSSTRNSDAFAIAETMSGLRHLQLFGNCLSPMGLHRILTGCPHLESIDLRRAGVGWIDDGDREVLEGLKKFRLPKHDIHDYEHGEIHKRLDEDYLAYLKTIYDPDD